MLKRNGQKCQSEGRTWATAEIWNYWMQVRKYRCCSTIRTWNPRVSQKSTSKMHFEILTCLVWCPKLKSISIFLHKCHFPWTFWKTICMHEFQHYLHQDKLIFYVDFPWAFLKYSYIWQCGGRGEYVLGKLQLMSINSWARKIRAWGAEDRAKGCLGYKGSNWS